MSLAKTTALATNLVAKASGGDLYAVYGYNNSGSAQFIQVHNTASLPADTAVPTFTFKAAAGANFELKFDLPVRLGTGITVCNSSTVATKTIGSADCWFNVVYI